MLDGIVDIYLPDFKYQEGALAAKYSSGALDYPEVAAATIKEMHRQVGELQVDLKEWRAGTDYSTPVMPGNIAAQTASSNGGKRSHYSHLCKPDGQYRPEHKAFDYPELSRRITIRNGCSSLLAKGAGLIHFDL